MKHHVSFFSIYTGDLATRRTLCQRGDTKEYFQFYFKQALTGYDYGSQCTQNNAKIVLFLTSSIYSS
jgi:hypothetical protein